MPINEAKQQKTDTYKGKGRAKKENRLLKRRPRRRLAQESKYAIRSFNIKDKLFTPSPP